MKKNIVKSVILFLLFESSRFCARPDRNFELETKHVIFIMLGTFPKDFFQVAIFHECAISKVATLYVTPN